MDDADQLIIDQFRRALVESLFRGYIEDGSIEVGHRTFEEISQDFTELLREFIDGPDFNGEDIRPIFDHEKVILERAAKEVNEGDALIGIMFYATWAEHFVNGILIRSFVRAGVDEDVYMPMIRMLNLQIKLTSTWQIAGLPKVPTETLRTLNQATELRNGFVHYKWTAMSRVAEENHKTRIRDVVGQLPALVEYFQNLDDQFFWNGRENEIITAFRAEVKRREEEDPPPWSAHEGSTA